MNLQYKSALAAVLLSRHTQRVRRSWYEARRRLARRGHRLIFYHRVADAWSWLLAQALQELTMRYRIEIEIRPVATLPVDYVHDVSQMDRYAVYDARRLSRAWGLEFNDSDKPPDPSLCRLAERIVLARPEVSTLLHATAAAWHGDEARLAILANEGGAVDELHARAALEKNEASLVRRGHYLGAMIWYGGDWYWGLDRLNFLERRLRDLGLGDGGETLQDRRFSPLTRAQAGSPVAQTLEVYFSFRSPYSYLAAEQAGVFADRLGLELKWRPLLPMINRGIPLPRSKLRYIVTDAARMAESQRIAFGPLRDPVGEAVERCLALTVEAGRAGRAREFVLAAMRAIWTCAADLSDSDTLVRLATEAGLQRDAVDTALASNQWRAEVETNAAALAVLGLWGVPSLCLRGADERPVAVAWGQDRFWAIERAAIGLDTALPVPGPVEVAQRTGG